jgi:hypothetical protein
MDQLDEETLGINKPIAKGMPVFNPIKATSFDTHDSFRQLNRIL